MILTRPRLRLRRMRAGDAEAWRDLRLEALSFHPEAYGASHDDWAGRPLSDFADQLERGCVLAAFIGAEPVGCMALVLDGDAAEIASVYVRPAYRRRGIARRLLRSVLSEARQRGVARLSLSVAEQNEPAMLFYRRAGFSPEAHRPPRALARDGRLLDLISMTRVP